jgi:hypothetical protein
MRVHIPMPLQIVIDDVGWWCGEKGVPPREPPRTGMPRNHVPADYAAVVSLGRKLGVRPQAAMILCEWDRENILRNTPWTTWMGERWDNSRWVGPWMEEAAQIMRDGAAHFEFTLHGVGHEYWQNGEYTRAEWHDAQGNMRPRDHVLADLDSFHRIMDQHDLGAFPESFVPCAFKHAFGRENGLAGILREHGIKCISTPFNIMVAARPTEEPLFGNDDGIMTVDRGDNGIRWNTVAAQPLSEIRGPIYGLHWPNILHRDPARNEEVVEQWVPQFREYHNHPDSILSPNTAACWTQLAYRVGTTVKIGEREIELDFARFDRLSPSHLLDWFTIKLEAAESFQISSDDLKIVESKIPRGADWRVLRLYRGRNATKARLRLHP